MLADQIAGAVDAARSTRTLDEVARVMWRAVAEGHLDEPAAVRLGEAVEARRTILRGSGPGRAGRPPAGRVGGDNSPSRCQRSPDRQRSIERRRRIAAAGPMPPNLASHFTVGQLAALGVVAGEIARRGRCDRSMDEIAARAGVCRRTVRNALKEAEALGLLRVEERRLSAWRNDTNLVTITSPEWSAWLRLRGWGKKDAAHGPESISRSLTVAQTAPQTGLGRWRGGARRPEPILRR